MIGRMMGLPRFGGENRRGMRLAGTTLPLRRNFPTANLMPAWRKLPRSPHAQRPKVALRPAEYWTDCIDWNRPLEQTELPAGWRWTTISAIAKSMKNGVYKPPDSYADDGIACLRMYNIDQGAIVWKDIKRLRLSAEEFAMYELLPGDVLVNRVNSRELVGKSAVIPDNLERCVYESKNIRLRLDRTISEPKYVGYWLRAYARQYFNDNAQQTVGMASINQIQLGAMPLPLPPLPEQQAIVAAIETQFTPLDAAVAALKRVQANLRRYRAAVLKAACEGQLVPTEADLAQAEGRGYEPAAALLARILHERRARWQADHPGKKYKEPAGPDTSALPELPEGWCWATVEQVAEHRLGKMLDQVKNKGTPVPYLRNINVRWFSFDFNDLQVMRIQPNEIEDVSVREGDLVVCEGGEPGRCAVWNRSDSTMVIQKALHRVRLHSDVMPWFLAIKLRADASSGSLERYFTGSTIKHLTGESLRRYVLPLAPLAEQRCIIDEVQRHLSLIEGLEQETAASMTRAARLRQSILQRAFSGQLLE